MFGKKSKYDFLIVGLGNPTLKYENTRHNIGFMSVDKLAEKYGEEIKKPKNKALIGEIKVGNRLCLVIKPQTYMNNSGEAVGEIARFYKMPAENIIVIFDDVSFDIGKLRVRKKGSDGGHNGIKSIICHLNSQEFMRIKVGVGKKPHPDYDLADWVLAKFKGEDAKAVEQTLPKVVNACECLITNGIDEAMNKFNG